MRRTLVAALVLLGSLLPASGAAAEVKMQALLNPDGSGRLFVNDSGEGWLWEACSPDQSTCRPFSAGRDISTTGASAETVFRVSNGGSPGLSPFWHGNVALLSPPSVTGAIRANELVTPVAGKWSGGWEGEKGNFQLAACTSPVGGRCTTLTHSHYVPACPGESAVLDPVFAGQYLRVAERRVGAGPHFVLAYAVGSPYGHEVWGQDQRTAVTFFGPIEPATQRRSAKCGPPPLVEASISKRGVATVRCGLGCRAALVARQGKRRARVTRKLAPLLGTLPKGVIPPQLRLKKQHWTRFEPGRVRAVVEVNGRVVASRSIRMPRRSAPDTVRGR